LSLPRPSAGARRLPPENLAALGGFLRFALVGASGVLVNLVVLAAALRLGRSSSVLAAQPVAETVATQVAILWNFALTEAWVFGAEAARLGRLGRLTGYWLVSMLALAVQLPLATGLAHVLGLGYVVATAVALGLLVVGRYVICRAGLYRRRPSDGTVPPAHVTAGHPASIEWAA
jgi:dolichol-phosphate mannosyltransferase